MENKLKATNEPLGAGKDDKMKLKVHQLQKHWSVSLCTMLRIIEEHSPKPLALKTVGNRQTQKLAIFKMEKIIRDVKTIKCKDNFIKLRNSKKKSFFQTFEIFFTQNYIFRSIFSTEHPHWHLKWL